MHASPGGAGSAFLMACDCQHATMAQASTVLRVASCLGTCARGVCTRCCPSQPPCMPACVHAGRQQHRRRREHRRGGGRRAGRRAQPWQAAPAGAQGPREGRRPLGARRRHMIFAGGVESACRDDPAAGPVPLHSPSAQPRTRTRELFAWAGLPATPHAQAVPHAPRPA